jgi:8-oxo-dGTP diphosphatase
MNARVIVVGVIEKDGKILVGKKAPNTGPYPNTYHIPGGGVEMGQESLEEALIREVREEVGIEIGDITPVTFDEDSEPNKHGEMTHYLFLSYTAKYVSGEIKPGDDMHNLEWVEKNELRKLNLNKPSLKLLKTLRYL